MIFVSRNTDGSYSIVNGNRRLQAMLDLGRDVEVQDVETKKILHVHNVDGRLIAISEESQVKLNDLTNDIISNAKNG